MKIYDLKTEYQVNPVIDNLQPRFSWKIESDKFCVKQTAYRIVVKTQDEIMWDSGIVESDESRFVRYAGKPLSSRLKLSWQVIVFISSKGGVKENAKSEWVSFETGLLKKEDWKCFWIEPETDIDRAARKPCPVLRKTFIIEKAIKQAKIYCTAHGLYDLYINGKSASEDKFKPGFTSYYHRIQYQSYDITSLIKHGKNVWAVILGDGWWRGYMSGVGCNNFGYKLQYFGQIEIEFADGTTQKIITDDSFKHSTEAYLAGDMLFGEIYDARLESKWKETEYDDGAWDFVHTIDGGNAKLITSGLPVTEHETFVGKPFKDSNGDLVIDFGQNIAGYVKSIFRNTKRGQKITIIHGETLDNDGAFTIANVSDYTVPVPAFQQTEYICKGNEYECYSPTFSVFGFRYIKINGYDFNLIQKGDFISVAVYSDMEETGSFTCSNPLINQLVQNSLWSQKGNFLDVATDCPTRERNPWTGDSQVYCRTAAYFMNVYPFFEKWLIDQKIEQFASGKLDFTFPATGSIHNEEELKYVKANNPLVSLAGPEGNGGPFGQDSAGWGDAAVWNPYSMYLYYGDKQIIENQYITAKKWVDYMLASAKEKNPLYENEPQYHTYTDGTLDADYIYDTKFHFGEWLEPIPKETNGMDLGEIFIAVTKKGRALVATAYMKRSCDNLSHMASILGNKVDAEYYKKVADRIADVYQKYFIADDGTIEKGHQAAYVRALVMGLCGNKKKEVLMKLIQEIKDYGFRLNTGFLSTPFLLPVLSDFGYTEIAFKLLEQTQFPSWLHSVQLGATTIPESWDGFDKKYNSLNHYSYGAVCEFLFGYIGGIRPQFDEAGFKKFILKPFFGGNLTSADSKYKSPFGTIISKWDRDGNKFRYSCTIPANSQAELTLPNGEKYSLGSGTYTFSVNIGGSYDL